MNERLPLISVIIPVYNVEQYLEKSVNSVRNQTYGNLEIILVDDGSPDDCGLLCDYFAKMDSRIKVIHQVNGGLSDARNSGINASNGEYLAFVDSDDMIAPDMIEELFRRLCDDRSDLALCGYRRIDSDNQTLGSFTLDDQVVSGYSALEMGYQNNGVLFSVVWNKLYKRSLFGKIRFPVGKYHEDEFTSYRIIDLCNRVSIIKKELYFYMDRSNSIMAEDYSVRRLDGIEASFQKYCYYRQKGNDYLQFLSLEGNEFAPLFFQSKLRFQPKTREEKIRVKEIDRMARKVCFDRFFEWSLARKLKLLLPAVYINASRIKKNIRF